MIVLKDMTKSFMLGKEEIFVLKPMNLAIPSDKRLVVLGHQGVGKTTLIRILAGIMAPTSGYVERWSRVSFPIGHVGGFRSRLSVHQNLSYAARIFGVDVANLVGFIDSILNIKSVLNLEMEDVPQETRREIAFVLSYAIPFDVYLIDGRFETGSPHLRQTCRKMLNKRLETASIIMTTTKIRVAEEFGEVVAILTNGELRFFDHVPEAVREYKRLAPALNSADERRASRLRRIAERRLLEDDDEDE